MSMNRMLLHVFHRKTQVDTPPPPSPPVAAAASSKIPVDWMDRAPRPAGRRAAVRPVPLAHVKRGDKVGQGCWFSDKNIIAPLCGTCINIDNGVKGLLCFCCPLCIGH